MDKLCKIRDVQRGVISFELQFEKRYGICMNVGMLLCSLSKTERLSSGELGELLGLTPSNMSKVIASAENKNLIERFLCKEDKRQMRFSLTDAGRALIASINCDDLSIPDVLNNIL
ncbi:MAG: MarR family transcriptional regulator [Muribaculaceae bacterium]|nr:MarR family transcriptional regulator [Muribaculaceae bacterium]